VSTLNTTGIMGIAVNGVPFVSEHIHNNGNVEETSVVFDDCGGHMRMANNGYHYHLPPACLIRSLGGDAPAVNWIHQMKNWPELTADPSPLIGYALDGHPIYGPNGEDGSLMVPTHVDGSILDECNGMIGNDGSYRYYITTLPPFVPACLRGSQMGTAEHIGQVQENCPVITGDSPPIVILESQDTICETVPQFLFRDFLYEDPKWYTHNIISAVMFGGLTILLLLWPKFTNVKVSASSRTSRASVFAPRNSQHCVEIEMAQFQEAHALQEKINAKSGDFDELEELASEHFSVSDLVLIAAMPLEDARGHVTKIKKSALIFAFVRTLFFCLDPYFMRDVLNSGEAGVGAVLQGFAYGLPFLITNRMLFGITYPQLVKHLVATRPPVHAMKIARWTKYFAGMNFTLQCITQVGGKEVFEFNE